MNLCGSSKLCTADLASYGCQHSLSKRDDSLLHRVLDGDEFRNIFWHRHVLETAVTLKDETEQEDEHARKLRKLAQWRACYERVQCDFDAFLDAEGIEYVLYAQLFAQLDWQTRLNDLAIETLIPGEDIEIVLSGWFLKADIFLREDKRLIRFSFSLPLAPGIPAFCAPENLERTLAEQRAGFKTYPDD